MNEDQPDPRVEKHGICGVTFVGSTGIEWVCIRKVHAKVYDTRRGYRIQEGGQSEQHYFVNKWPNRPTQANEEQSWKSISY